MKELGFVIFIIDRAHPLKMRSNVFMNLFAKKCSPKNVKKT